MRAAVICNGIIDDYELISSEIAKYDIIICSDGGIKHLIRMNIKPDVFIGDFDSCDYENIRYNPIFENTVFFRHPIEKDATDTQICIDYALKNGYNYITLFSALGGRIDHELSNVFYLAYIHQNNAVGNIFSEKNIIYITDSVLKIEKKDGFKLSIIPLSSTADNITAKGLYYPLKNALLVQGDSRGVSNEFVDNEAEISVENGLIFIILSKD